MKMRCLSVFLLFILFTRCGGGRSSDESSAKDNPSRADLVLLNGKIWTAEGAAIFNEAIAIHDNVILAVGSSPEIQKLVDDKTKIVDLNGKLVIPGFNDAHIHFLSGSLGLSQVEFSGSESIGEMITIVTEFAKKNPGAAWITGRGWQYTQFAGGLPSRQLLDSAINDRPVFIKAYDGHSAWANSKALSMAGINRNTKYNGYGEIVHDAKDEPTGALKEGAQSIVGDLVPKPTREEMMNAVRAGMKLASSLGITSLQNASGSPMEFSLYEELLKNNELTLRIAAAFSVDPETTVAEIDSFTNIKNRAIGNPMIRASSVKFMLDGVIESHTAGMLAPYADLPLSDPSSVGSLRWPLSAYRGLVTRLDKLGFQLYTHAIGDKAVREALNAYENAMNINGAREAHHRIEHIETVSPDDLPRFAQLGVMPSMEPIHADPATLGVWEKAIGARRLPNSFAWSFMLQNKAHLVFSSDWPACIDLSPIHGIHIAVNRKSIDGQPLSGWVPNQKITITDALTAYTLAGAYSSFEDHIKGKIAKQYLADLVVLSDDLFTMNPLQIHKAKVMMTIFDGKIIYIRDQK